MFFNRGGHSGECGEYHGGEPQREDETRFGVPRRGVENFGGLAAGADEFIEHAARAEREFAGHWGVVHGERGAAWTAGAQHPGQGVPHYLVGQPRDPHHGRGGEIKSEGGGAGGGEGGGTFFHTFNPPGAHWSLNDYAWDWRVGRVVSRNSIAALTAARAAAALQQQHDFADHIQNQGGGGVAAPPPPPHFSSFGGGGGKGMMANPVADPPRARVVSDCDTSSEGSDGGELKRGGVEDHRNNNKTTPDGKAPRKSRVSAAARDHNGVGIGKDRDAPPAVRLCPVQGCSKQCLPSSKKRIERILCVHHSQQPQVLVEGETRRFCQVCYVLHRGDAFRGKNKTCNSVLERKKLLRWNGTHGGGGGATDSGTTAGTYTTAEWAAKTGGTAATGGAAATAKKKRSRPSASEETVHNPANAEALALDEGAEGEQSIWSAIKRTVGVSTKPASKRVRVDDRHVANAFDPLYVLNDADRQLVRDMEEGALTSLVVPSAAIKVPYAVPEDLLAGGGSSGAPVTAGGMNELLRWMDCGLPSDMGAPPHMGAGAGASLSCGGNIVEVADRAVHQRGPSGDWPAHDFNDASLEQFDGSIHAPAHRVFEETLALSGFGFLNAGMLGGSAPGGGLIPEEDLGFDVFIRPGSLIFGVHAQGAVVSPTATELARVGAAPEAEAGAGAGASAGAAGGEGQSSQQRHTAASLLVACATGDSVESKLVRTATAALHSGFGSNSSYWSSRGGGSGSGSGHGGGGGHQSSNGAGDQQINPPSYDATGPGLLTIPEGVFGSFNGEISRLEIGPDGVPLTVAVTGLPKGFPAGLLDAASSILDSSKRTATVRLPWTPQPGTTIVCMFRGAHLPLRVQSMARGVTELEIAFAPEGGFEVPVKWTVSGGADLKAAAATIESEGGEGGSGGEEGEDGDGDRDVLEPPPLNAGSGSAAAAAARRRAQQTDDARARRGSRAQQTWIEESIKNGGALFDNLEGTATLEVLIADGPMRGLPVGATVPLLLTPDSELREELVSAMVPLQLTMNNNPRGRRVTGRGGRQRKPLRRVDEDEEAEEEDTEEEDDTEDGEEVEEEVVVMPPPVALTSMLGAVLASHRRGQEPNPRMWRGVVAMTRFFKLRHTAERLGMDFIPRPPSGVAGAGMTAFNAVTDVLAALWSVRMVGVVTLLLCLVIKKFYPMVNWEGAVSFQTFTAALWAFLPTMMYRAVWQHQSLLSFASSAARIIQLRPTYAHGEHAVTAQNCGALIGPFFAVAVIIAHIKRLFRKNAADITDGAGVWGAGASTGDLALALGEHEMSWGYMLCMVTAEVIPAAALLLAFQYVSASTRLRHWPSVSLVVHATRAVACLIRTHHNYYHRKQLYQGMFINVVSTVTAVLMFPMWSSAQMLAMGLGLVVCDWAGHYLHAGTIPAYLIPSPGPTDVMTAEDAWTSAVSDIVWRVLMPAAVNSYVMHLLVKQKRRTVKQAEASASGLRKTKHA